MAVAPAAHDAIVSARQVVWGTVALTQYVRRCAALAAQPSRTQYSCVSDCAMPPGFRRHG